MFLAIFVYFSKPHGKKKSFANYPLNIWKSLFQRRRRSSCYALLLLFSTSFFFFFHLSYFLPIYISEWMSLYSEGEAWQHIFSPSISNMSGKAQSWYTPMAAKSVYRTLWAQESHSRVHFYNDRVIPINWEFL